MFVAHQSSLSSCGCEKKKVVVGFAAGRARWVEAIPHIAISYCHKYLDRNMNFLVTTILEPYQTLPTGKLHFDL